MEDKSRRQKRGSRTARIVGAITIVAAGLIGIVLFATDFFGLRQIKVKIGYSKYPYPPMHYTDSSGELIGFDVELAKAAAEIMNAKVEFVPIDWSNRAELLASGEVDMLWGGLGRASLDERKVKFTASYLRSDIVLLMNDDRDYTQFTDLHGLNVCALNFTPAYYYAQIYSKDIIKSRSSFTPTGYLELKDSLSSGQFDCMITDTSFAAFFQEMTGIEYKVSDTILASNYAVAVRVEDTKLFDALQDALNQLETDGTIAGLREKWIASP